MTTPMMAAGTPAAGARGAVATTSPRAAQLALPLPTEGARVSRSPRVDIRWSREADGAAVEIHGPEHAGCRFDIRVRGRPRVTIEGDTPVTWNMRARPAVTDASEIFGFAFRRARAAAFDSDDAPSPCAGPTGLESAGRALGRIAAQVDAQEPVLAAIRRALSEIAAHLAACCEARARRCAGRFSVPFRFRVYSLLAGDGTGRLAQLSRSCPGALLFALGLLDSGDGPSAEAARALLEGAKAGRRLNELLDGAVRAWVDSAPRLLAAADLPGRGAWRAIAQSSPGELSRLCLAQRLLIRRAGPAVHPEFLWLPPPVAFAPEDIPGGPSANGLWFAVMKAEEELLWHSAIDGPRRALSVFLSRHACDRVGEDGSKWVRTGIRRLLEFVATTGRRLDRRRSPESALQEVERWQERHFLEPGGPGLSRIVLSVRGLSDATVHTVRNLALPEPPVPGSTGPGLVIRPLRTAGELIDEALRMRHCAAARLPDILRKECALYGAAVNGQRLTVEVFEDRFGRLRLGEVKGARNRLPTVAETRALRQWLKRAAAPETDPEPVTDTVTEPAPDPDPVTDTVTDPDPDTVTDPDTDTATAPASGSTGQPQASSSIRLNS